MIGAMVYPCLEKKKEQKLKNNNNNNNKLIQAGAKFSCELWQAC